jgi:N-acetyl-anhydromuramyl-L-alanine amidase AmpD
MQINLKLDKIDLQYILEALLFASCCDVCGDWYQEDFVKLLEIVKKIKSEYPDLKTQNVFIHNPMLSDQIHGVDSLTPDIIQNFPEILKDNII